MRLFERAAHSLRSRPVGNMIGLGACLLFTITGHYWLCSRDANFVLPPFMRAAERMNDFLHLWLEHPSNILAGLVAIACGGILFGYIASLPRWLESGSETWLRHEPWILSRTAFLGLAASLVIYTAVAIELAQHRYSSLLVQTGLLTLLFPSIILWISDRGRGVSLRPNLSRRDAIWIFLLFGFAIASGSFLLNELPAGWISDEGAFWETARGLALGEIQPILFDFGVYSFPLASSILQGWILRFAGVDFWGWRFASVLPASASVIALYMLAHELFDRRVAVAASVMMMVNPYFLSFARLGYNNSQSLLVVTVVIYFLVLGIRRGSRFYYWMAGLISGIGFYTYFAAWLGWVAGALILLIYALRSRTNFRELRMPFGLLVAGCIGVILPRILYGMSGEASSSLHYKIWETSLINTLYGAAIFGEGRLNQALIFLIAQQVEIYYDPALYGVALLRGLFLSVTALFDPVFYHDHYISYGLAGPVSSVFLVFGLAVVLLNLRRLAFLAVVVWFASGLLFLGVLAAIPPRPTHLVVIIPVMALISAIGLVSFIEALLSPNLFHDAATGAPRILLAGILTVVTISGWFQYFFTMPHSFAPSMSDYASWMGRKISTRANLIFVDVAPIEFVSRNEEDLRLSNHHISTVTRAALVQDPDQTRGWGDFVAFIGPGDSEKFALWLSGQIPGSAIQPAYGPHRNLRGYVVTNLSVNGLMDYSLAHGLQSLWSSPAQRFILTSLICAICLILVGRVRNHPGSPSES